MTDHLQAHIKAFFAPATRTASYVMYDHDGGHCAIVDSVLDFDAKSGRTSTTSADNLMAFVKEKALPVPGHTPACMAYRVKSEVGSSAVFEGTARCDFPGGNAHDLFKSVRSLMELPGDTRLYMCHDYPPDAREPVWESTVAEQRTSNMDGRI